jgi:hypothetical protein
MLRSIRWVLFAGLQGCVFFSLPSCLGPSNNRPGSSRPAVIISGDQLNLTTMSPGLREAISPGRNLLWCGTFQLAWNELTKLIGGPAHLEPGSPLVSELNRQEFTRESVDPANCVAIADFVRNDVYGRIERALKTIASKEDYRRCQPHRDIAVRPQDIVAYAYLQADLRYPVPFEKLDGRLTFQGTPVSAFGIGEERKPDQARLYPQVCVHDYNGREDFVVELASRTKGDRLILARLKPAETLLATIQEVERRLTPVPSSRDPAKLTKEQRQQALDHLAHAGDVLIVPKMGFEMTRSYDELTGRHLRPTTRGVDDDLWLLDAVQFIRFEMNEEGASLRSYAQMSFTCSAERPPPPDRWMVFDGPFLLMLQREGASLPYFAAWFGDAELLQK